MSATRLIVDGNNVIGSRPDGWWRDRTGATRRLIAALQRLAAANDDRIAVVLDGRPLADLPEGVHNGVLVAYATRGGRDAADDRIAAEVARDRDPASLARVLVVPRPGFDVEDADVLDVPPHLGAVSSSAARAGRTDLIAPECRSQA